MKPLYIEGVSTSSTIFFPPPSNRIPDFSIIPFIGHYFCNIPYEINRVRYDSFLLLYTKSGKARSPSTAKRAFKIPEMCASLTVTTRISTALFGEWEILWLHFDGKTAGEYFLYLSEQPVFQLSLKDSSTYEKAGFSFMNAFSTRKCNLPRAFLYISTSFSLYSLWKR